MVVCSRTQSEIDSVVKEIRRMTTDGNNHHGESDDDRLLGIRCDISKSSEVDHLIKLTIAKFKFINILVNNAGIVFVKKLLDTSEEEWDKTIDTNLKGAFLCTKAVLPSMIQNRSGVIINVLRCWKDRISRIICILCKQVWYDRINRKFGMGSGKLRHTSYGNFSR